MGGTAIGPVVSSLVDHLKPKCLAMSGVCAGNPADVALGNMVPELAYAYDEGKRTQLAFEASIGKSPYWRLGSKKHKICRQLTCQVLARRPPLRRKFGYLKD